ncbi:MAG: DnaJ domain-containing protein [Pyrinomonadaceae bacterium]|nr:DnaJ domain-containing protein [Pyrinomonadaceae bacterium]
MVNYYDILKVSSQATGAEIKSAYRRLARRLHPDSKHGSEETALKFAAIAEAYEILGNSKERRKYDQRLQEVTAGSNGDPFLSSNPHIQRWRQMVVEKRYNDIIDQLLAEERDEALAFQKIVYPVVALFVSAIIVTALKPRIFDESLVIGKIIIVALFLVGVIHLVGRFREGLERYTESETNIHESILDEGEKKAKKPYSRLAAAAILVGGLIVCLAIGIAASTQIDFAASSLPRMFSPYLEPEFLFYPPIITLFVDIMHSFASSLDR